MSNIAVGTIYKGAGEYDTIEEWGSDEGIPRFQYNPSEEHPDRPWEHINPEYMSDGGSFRGFINEHRYRHEGDIAARIDEGTLVFESEGVVVSYTEDVWPVVGSVVTPDRPGMEGIKYVFGIKNAVAGWKVINDGTNEAGKFAAFIMGDADGEVWFEHDDIMTGLAEGRLTKH